MEKFITFICSLEENIDELDGKNIINKEIVRITSNLYDEWLEIDRWEKCIIRLRENIIEKMKK